MTALNLVLTVLNFLVPAGAGVGALLALRRDKRAAVLMLIGCVLLLVGAGVSIGNSYLGTAFGSVGGLEASTEIAVVGILTNLVDVGGWCLIVLALFLGARKRQAPGGYHPQPVPAQAGPGGPNPYAPPQYGPPQYGPPQYGPPPYGPPLNPYGR